MALDTNAITSFITANPAVVSSLIQNVLPPESVKPLATALLQNETVKSYIKSSFDIKLLQPYIDAYTDTYPVNFPDTPAFSAVGIDFTPFLLAGVVFPMLFIMLILVIMKNCYGYVFIFLWISVMVIWLGLNAIVFGQTYPFQKQINLISKYGLICIAILFTALTLIGFLLRILSFPLQILASPLSGGAGPPPPVYYYPPAPAPAPAPAPTPAPAPAQAGGGKRRNGRTGPPNLLYIPPNAT